MTFSCVINIEYFLDKPFEENIINKMKNLCNSGSFYFILSREEETEIIKINNFIKKYNLNNNNIVIKNYDQLYNKFIWYKIINYYYDKSLELKHRYINVIDDYNENSFIEAFNSFYEKAIFVQNHIDNNKNKYVFQNRNNNI